jgi:ribosome-binding factor A
MVDEKRKKRIGEQIQHELASILLRHPEQPLLVQATITAVDVSADLSVAKVFFSLFDEKKLAAVQEALTNATSLLRKALAKNLNLRLTPRLYFVYDKSIIGGQKLANLIDQAVAEDEQRHQK